MGMVVCTGERNEVVRLEEEQATARTEAGSLREWKTRQAKTTARLML
jgi:hypothetical protein